MKNFIIVSKCLRVTKISSNEFQGEFHFKGVFAGEVVKKVLLVSRTDTQISPHSEYLIFAEFIACEMNVLRGRIVKIKNIEECWDKS